METMVLPAISNCRLNSQSAFYSFNDSFIPIVKTWTAQFVDHSGTLKSSPTLYLQGRPSASTSKKLNNIGCLEKIRRTTTKYNKMVENKQNWMTRNHLRGSKATIILLGSQIRGKCDAAITVFANGAKTSWLARAGSDNSVPAGRCWRECYSRALSCPVKTFSSQRAQTAHRRRGQCNYLPWSSKSVTLPTSRCPGLGHPGPTASTRVIAVGTETPHLFALKCSLVVESHVFHLVTPVNYLLLEVNTLRTTTSTPRIARLNSSRFYFIIIQQLPIKEIAFCTNKIFHSLLVQICYRIMTAIQELIASLDENASY